MKNNDSTKVLEENTQPAPRLDLGEVRRRLAGSKGKAYWRSLDELAGTPEFQELLHREFPREASVMEDGVGRRNFLKIMSASLALAGLTSCARQPSEQILPYIQPPESVIPGKSQYFATAMTLGGYGIGLLAESHTGRPTKLEGNPSHSASLGSTTACEQASILTLYDPDRSNTILQRGEIATWEMFKEELTAALAPLKENGGRGVHILTGTVTSPALGHQLNQLRTKYPNITWHQFDAVNRDNVRKGARLAFGEDIETRYNFSKADCILALDADFFSEGPGRVRYTRDFSERRAPGNEGVAMNRLYAVESTPGLAGAMADHRLPLSPSRIAHFTHALAAALGVPGAAAPGELSEHEQHWLDVVAQDLRLHGANSLVLAGESQSADIQYLVHGINAALGGAGTTIEYTAPVEVEPVDQAASLRELNDAMAAGTVEMLFILDGNPVYNAPADFNFAENLKKVTSPIHLGLYNDETAELCHWHIPAAHYLESWGDVRAYDGAVSIIQPLIAPLYNGRTAHEVLALIDGEGPADAYGIVRQYWQGGSSDEDFNRQWTLALSEGVVASTTYEPRSVAFKAGNLSALPETDVSGIEVVFRPDPSVWDGSFNNNGWLQELPKPFSKVTWDNVIYVGFAMAERLGLQTEDRITVAVNGRTVEGPVWVLPGHADNVLTLYLGYGRGKLAGHVGAGAGYNAYTVRTSDAMDRATGATIEKGGVWKLARTAHHHSMEGRDIALSMTLDEYAGHGELDAADHHEAGDEGHGEENSLYNLTSELNETWDGAAWGMTIDLNKCTGCNACTMACQSENNIPIVGKDQVAKSREMHWIRVDTYYTGDDPENPETINQPVPCMHCENAPCEVVCPVGATVHSQEGLNEMTYNRCIGTRYCSNNCPYKVRRFNFLNYSGNDFNAPASQDMMHNPNVTVRGRGVMEKCTYCVQRISHARIEAKKDGRSIRDGEVTPACAQACPASAILFGDINDKSSRVSLSKGDKRNYSLLGELNTFPRTTYLTRVRNYNPELKALEAHGHSS